MEDLTAAGIADSTNQRLLDLSIRALTALLLSAMDPDADLLSRDKEKVEAVKIRLAASFEAAKLGQAANQAIEAADNVVTVNVGLLVTALVNEYHNTEKLRASA